MKNTVVIATSDLDKLYTEVKTADKNFFVDEPIEIGGTNLAPNPIEYFLGSLAACTTITLQLYAKRKGWNTGKIVVTAELDTNERLKNHDTETTVQSVVYLFPHRQGRELLDIGLEIFNENGIGQKDTNNGLLLIVATKEKKLRIITGKGMEFEWNTEHD